MKIDCVSISTVHSFPGNLVAEQHRLRYREVITKEGWSDVYVMDGMEFDRYDNLATEYLVARDEWGNVVGTIRSHPTTIPSMLSGSFDFLVTRSLPAGDKVLDLSRLVLDRTALPKEQRKPVVHALLLASLERGLQRGIDGYLGFMQPKIWASTFQGAGWEPKWLGDEKRLNSGDIVRAGYVTVNEAMGKRVRSVTGITEPVLNFGEGGEESLGMAFHSHLVSGAKKATR
ncbi:MAG TPA: acyl-homoserine-lactone synthase [Thermoanaerobaculia bacterium]|jgi:N-acyl-L-homoserine lactone synthetase